MKLIALLLLVLTPSLMFADGVSVFNFTGAVEVYQGAAPWAAKGLPYHDGDPVSGSFSYTPGGFGSPAALNFIIDGHAYATTGFASAWVSWAEGSRLLVSGFVPELGATAAIAFVGSTNVFGCSGSEDPSHCFYGPVPVALPSTLTTGFMAGWVMNELQIRDTGSFDTHLFSQNQFSNVFLNAPIGIVGIVPNVPSVPEPSTWVLLGTGLVAMVLRRRA